MEDKNTKYGITDVPVSQERKERLERLEHIDSIRRESFDPVINKPKKKSKFPIITAIILFFIVVFVVITFVIKSADIIIKPEKQSIMFSSEVYKANIFGDKNSKKVAGVNRSVGKIKIINNMSSSQSMRKETRFKTGDLVFKTYKSVVIPGKSSVVVDAFSDGFGEKYNLKKGEKMKIPGFLEAKMDNEYMLITGIIESNFSFSEDKKLSETTKEESAGSLKYEIETFVSTQQKEVESIGIEEVEKEAIGKIKITNSTSKNQKLRKETRFKTGDLIFKTYKSVTIPAKSSVVVGAFSDGFGKKYNLKKGEKMKIPGFLEAKMDKEYNSITGEIENDFTGGKIGKINVANKEDLAQSKEELKKIAISNLELKVKKSNKHDNFIFIDLDKDSINYVFKTTADSEKIMVVLEASQKIPIIAKKDFISEILRTFKIENQISDELYIDDYSNISFNLLNNENFNIDSGDDFSFIVKGKTNMMWTFDKKLFLNLTKGKDLDEIKKELSDSFNHFEVEITTFPSWVYHLPKNEDDINIIFEK